MNRFSRRLFGSVTCAFFASYLAVAVSAAEVLVHSQDQYQKAVESLTPGDSVVLANGEWRDFEISFYGDGTEEAPIRLTAETPGRVFITGRSNLSLGGSHLVVSGLVFRDGYTPTSTVIAFRRTKQHLAYNSRVTEVVIDSFNSPERHETDFWVMMYGKNNRFDHSFLAGKSNVGVTMAVRLDSEESQENGHRIDHNYFGPRPILGSNGGETLRIGTSKYSLTDSNTVIENNWFERCNGEVEIISVKSGNNVLRGNVFHASRGTLTLRHGNGNLVERNVYLGQLAPHTGGIRVINKRQTIRHNYMQGLTGRRFSGALVVMNGVPNSPINRYHQVEDSVIENNTIIDGFHIELAAGADEERSARPISSEMNRNLIVNSTQRDSIAVHDDISGISFSGNIANNVSALPSSGFTDREVELEQAPTGLFYPTDAALSEVGAPRSLQVVSRDSVGPSWYEKPQGQIEFDSGRTIKIDPGANSLTEAVQKSQPGDTIELGAGRYSTTRILEIKHPLSLRAKNGEAQKPSITFERTTLAEIQDGGSLLLSGLEIIGSSAPDAYGNSVIRTSRSSMLTNYRVRVENCTIKDLNVNHSFDFLRASQHTFAHTVAVTGSSFANITGDVLALDGEVDDLGIYSGEFIELSNSALTNVGGAALNVYRGGTDESTFGPEVKVIENTFLNVGNGRRNKTKASLALHGVQRVELSRNVVSESNPFRVVETVGEPRVFLDQNTFNQTALPELSKLSR